MLPAQTPAPIRTLLRRCLEKDRKRRLADAADARLEIEEALTAPVTNAPPTTLFAWFRSARLAWTVAAGVAARSHGNHRSCVAESGRGAGGRTPLAEIRSGVALWRRLVSVAQRIHGASGYLS